MALHRQEFKLDLSEPLYSKACPKKDLQTFDEALGDDKDVKGEGSQIGRLGRVFDNLEFSPATAKSISAHFILYEEKDSNFPEFGTFISKITSHKDQSPFGDNGELQLWAAFELPEIDPDTFSYLLDDIFKIASSAILTQDKTLRPWLAPYFETNRIKKASAKVNKETLHKLFIAGFTSRLLTTLFYTVHAKNERLLNIITYIIQTQLSISSKFLLAAIELREASKENKELSASEDFALFLQHIEDTINKMPRADTGKFLPLIALAGHVCTLAQSHPNTFLYFSAVKQFGEKVKQFNALIKENRSIEPYTDFNIEVNKINELIAIKKLGKELSELAGDPSPSFTEEKSEEEEKKAIRPNPLFEEAKKELQTLARTIASNDISTRYPGLENITEDFTLSDVTIEKTIQEIKAVNEIIMLASKTGSSPDNSRSSKKSSPNSTLSTLTIHTDSEDSPDELSEASSTNSDAKLDKSSAQPLNLDKIEQLLETITTLKIKNSLIAAFNIIGSEVADVSAPLEKKLAEKEAQMGTTLWLLSYLPFLIPDKETTKKTFLSLSTKKDTKSQKIFLYTLKTIKDAKFTVASTETKEIKDAVVNYKEELTRIRNPLWRSIYSFLSCFGVSTPHDSKTTQSIIDACKDKLDRIDTAIKYLK